MDNDLIELKKDGKGLKKTIVELDKKLSKHIVFIEQVYAPLQKSIDKFKRIFK